MNALGWIGLIVLAIYCLIICVFSTISSIKGDEINDVSFREK